MTQSSGRWRRCPQCGALGSMTARVADLAHESERGCAGGAVARDVGYRLPPCSSGRGSGLRAESYRKYFCAEEGMLEGGR